VIEYQKSIASLVFSFSAAYSVARFTFILKPVHFMCVEMFFGFELSAVGTTKPRPAVAGGSVNIE
jgi:hypothetical protein